MRFSSFGVDFSFGDLAVKFSVHDCASFFENR